MARTLAQLPKGSRISDYISLGVIAKTFPVQKIQSSIPPTLRNHPASRWNAGSWRTDSSRGTPAVSSCYPAAEQPSARMSAFAGCVCHFGPSVFPRASPNTRHLITFLWYSVFDGKQEDTDGAHAGPATPRFANRR